MEDQDIWQRLKAGHADAVDSLMRKYYNDLYNYGFKISMNKSLTKDCIQELFLKIWKDKENLSDVFFVKTYLLKALKRKMIKALVKENVFSSYDGLDEDKLQIVFSPQDILIFDQEISDRKDAVLRALNQLSKRHKEAIFLKFYQDLSNEEIAEMMSIKTQSVYNLIYEAIAILRNTIALSLSLFFLSTL